MFLLLERFSELQTGEFVDGSGQVKQHRHHDQD